MGGERRPAECAECAALEKIPPEQRIGNHDLPTAWWHCGRCGRHIERYWGQGDGVCLCGAQYNGWGQRLRDDWSPPPLGFEELELPDLEEYELVQLLRERALP